MAPYALFSWAAASDALAWATLAIIAQSDWDDLFAYADMRIHVGAVETTAQDQANDWIEGRGDPSTPSSRRHLYVLSKTGVQGLGDGSQYAGLQDYRGGSLAGVGTPELIFVHNHTNGDRKLRDDDLKQRV